MSLAIQKAGLAAGPLLALGTGVTLALHSDLSREASALAGITVMMAIWWSSEAIPIAVTSLIPLGLFPLLGILSPSQSAQPYGHPLIYLFLGGFIIAKALEKTGAHRRIALSILLVFGTKPQKLIIGFMVSCALLSMWVTNTATTMMMVPIALSILEVFKSEQPTNAESNFAKALLLAIGYSASIGGIGTLVGTVPNAVFAAFAEDALQIKITFSDWFKYGFPVMLALLPLVYLVIVQSFDFRGVSAKDKDIIHKQAALLGPMTRDELIAMLVLLFTAICWIFRPVINDHITGLDLTDTSIAIIASISLFIFPSQVPNKRLMDWQSAKTIPWGVLLLFGGGLSLAEAIKSTGLSDWLGNLLLGGSGQLSFFLAMMMVTTFTIFVTELTSNTATTATFMPIILAVTTASGFAPTALLIPVTIAASCAFMFPVATPPNAIVFSSGHIEMRDMIRAGAKLNVLAALVICAVVYFIHQSH